MCGAGREIRYLIFPILEARTWNMKTIRWAGCRKRLIDVGSSGMHALLFILYVIVCMNITYADNVW